MAELYNLKKGESEISDLKDVTVTAAELNILDGVTATAAEINTLDNVIAGATIVVNAEDAGTDTINVAIQLTDAAGSAMATRGRVFAYLSDDANGDSHSQTAPDGGVAIGTDGVAIEVVDNTAFHLISEADGDIDLDIVDSGTPTFYLVVTLPNGSLTVSDAITFA